MMNHNTVHIQLQFQMIEDIQELHFIGKLVYGQTQHAKDELKTHLQKVNGYILNMSKLEMIDSTGFGVIINLAKQVRDFGAKMAIVVTDPAIKEYFHMAKFHMLFPIVDDVTKAVAIIHDGSTFEKLVSDY